MASLNKIMLIGNLTRDPESLEAGSSSVCKFGLAVNESFKNAAGETVERVNFFDIEAWGRQGETCQQYLKRGAPVFVEGSMKSDKFEDKETGKQRTAWKVRADRVQFLSARPAGDGDPQEQAQPQSAPTRDGKSDEEIPF